MNGKAAPACWSHPMRRGFFNAPGFVLVDSPYGAWVPGTNEGCERAFVAFMARVLGGEVVEL